jgi:hypothetical protein
MSLRNTHLKLVGASSAALLIAGMAASPALAAPTTVSYTCGPVVLPITMDPGTLPTSMVAGQKIKQPFASAVVHLDAQTVAVAQSQGWTSVAGNSTGDGSDGGVVYKLNIAQTALPATPQPLDLPASGKLTLQPVKAGTYKVFAGTSVAFIQGYDASGPTNSITLPCTPPTDGSNQFGTIAVSKDKTKTAVAATYSAAKKMAKGTAKVKSHFGLKATGKVKFTLMRGTHKVITEKTKLNKKGIAKFMEMGLTKKGTYTLKATYLGSKALKTSSGKTTFKV